MPSASIGIGWYLSSSAYSPSKMWLASTSVIVCVPQCGSSDGGSPRLPILSTPPFFWASALGATSTRRSKSGSAISLRIVLASGRGRMSGAGPRGKRVTPYRPRRAPSQGGTAPRAPRRQRHGHDRGRAGDERQASGAPQGGVAEDAADRGARESFRPPGI